MIRACPLGSLSRMALFEEEPWMKEAQCRDTDTDVFFPRSSTGRGRGQTAQSARMETLAKSICAECSVRVECLEFAIVTNQDEGIWGGLNPKERRRARARLLRR